MFRFLIFTLVIQAYLTAKKADKKPKAGEGKQMDMETVMSLMDSMESMGGFGNMPKSKIQNDKKILKKLKIQFARYDVNKVESINLGQRTRLQRIQDLSPRRS